MHLLDDLKAFGHDLAALAIGKQAMNRFVEFLLNSRDAAQTLKIVHHIQNQWCLAVSRC